MAADEPQTSLTRPASLLRGIYAIVNADDDPIRIAAAALDAGVRIVQYRAKHGIAIDELEYLRRITRARGALLIVNDDWHTASALEADGVHLGPDDDGFSEIARVRSVAGPLIIGVSAGTVEEARAAYAGGADYLGVGAVFATSSKPDAGAPIGIAGLERIAAATPLPVAAIGGITLDRLPAVRATGVAMAAVISAIAGDDRPGQAAAKLVRAWNG
jgi:thiamine-phosphate pyrophosphorylase